MSYKKRELYIIPTHDKYYHDIKIGDNGVMFSEAEVGSEKYINNEPVKHYHIYITSNEEIKKGNWYYDTFDRKIRQALSDITEDSAFFKSAKRIIATTNKTLTIQINNPQKTLNRKFKSLAQIPRDFLDMLFEKYNNGELPTKVLVEYEDLNHKCGLQGFNPMLGDTCPVCDSESGLIINVKNNINVKFLKESWTREEHEKNLKYCVAEIAAKLGYASTSEEMKLWNIETNKWIEENL